MIASRTEQPWPSERIAQTDIVLAEVPPFFGTRIWLWSLVTRLYILLQAAVVDGYLETQLSAPRDVRSTSGP